MAIISRCYRGAATREVAKWNRDLIYNRSPLIEQQMRFRRTSHTQGFQLAKDLAEFMGMCDGLVQCGHIPAIVQKLNTSSSPSPDFQVTLKGGNDIYVEVTTAGSGDIIRQETVVPDMSNRMQRWLDEDATARDKLDNWFLSFNPARMFAIQKEEHAIAEMKAYVLNEDAPSQESSVLVHEEDYPTLHSAGVCARWRRGSSGPVIHVQAPGGSYSPAAELKSGLAAIERKRARDYAEFRPIWLVVDITHVVEPPSAVFPYLSETVGCTRPFERVIVCNSNEALELVEVG